MQWTEEQEEIFRWFRTGRGNLLVDAKAGSGKSTTIREGVVWAPEVSVLICAFNKHIADEMNESLSQIKGRVIKAATMHSVGYEIIRQNWPKTPLREHRTEELARAVFDKAKIKKRFSLIKAVVDTCAKVKNALPEAETVEDIMMIGEDFDTFAQPKMMPWDEQAELILATLEVSKQNTGSIGYDDMIWLPIANKWKPKSRFRLVVIDEIQDLNAAQLTIAQMMVAEPFGRLMFVGDVNQCHPAGTLVRTSNGDIPIENLDHAKHRIIPFQRKAQRVTGTRNFTLGRRSYQGDLLQIHVNSRSVEVTPNHKLLVRWTSKDIARDTFVVYLMWRPDYGFRVGWCQLVSGIKDTYPFNLRHRALMQKAERTWILKACTSKATASLYESYVATKFGLPLPNFVEANECYIYTQEALDQFFASLNKKEQESRGRAALVEHGLDFDLPLLPLLDQNRDGSRHRNTYYTIYAANLLPEIMAIPLPEGANNWAKVDSITKRSFEGLVYSLEVDRDPYYVANGLVVHNSVYSWRGADRYSIPRVRKEVECKELPLNVSFRCSKAVIAEAQTIVPSIKAKLDAPHGKIHHISFPEISLYAQPGDFVLSRFNAPLISACIAIRRMGLKAHIDGRDALSQARNILGKIERTGTSLISFERDVATWMQKEIAIARSRSSPARSQRATDFGMLLGRLAREASSMAEIHEILDALFKGRRSPNAIVCSTIHRSKGREAPRVFLLKDTLPLKQASPEYEYDLHEEKNLEYIAITRSQHDLFWVSGLPAEQSRPVLIDPFDDQKAEDKRLREELSVSSGGLSAEEAEALSSEDW